MYKEKPHDKTPPCASHFAKSCTSEGFRVRRYQLEMLDRSLDGNVIIVVRKYYDSTLFDTDN
jgi:hypothetical protein